MSLAQLCICHLGSGIFSVKGKVYQQHKADEHLPSWLIKVSTVKAEFPNDLEKGFFSFSPHPDAEWSQLQPTCCLLKAGQVLGEPAEQTSEQRMSAYSCGRSQTCSWVTLRSWWEHTRSIKPLLLILPLPITKDWAWNLLQNPYERKPLPCSQKRQFTVSKNICQYFRGIPIDFNRNVSISMTLHQSFNTHL